MWCFLTVSTTCSTFLPATLLSVNFQSCIFHPCKFVRHFPVLQFPALHFCPSFSSPANSAPPTSRAEDGLESRVLVIDRSPTWKYLASGSAVVTRQTALARPNVNTLIVKDSSCSKNAQSLFCRILFGALSPDCVQ